MLFHRPVAISTVLDRYKDAKLVGRGIKQIDRAALVPFAEPGDTVFVDKARWFDAAVASPAILVVTTDALIAQLRSEELSRRSFLTHVEPFDVFCYIVSDGLGPIQPNIADSSSASLSEASSCIDSIIASTAAIGVDTLLGRGAFVGERCRIGDRCKIGSGARILDDVQLGDEVIVEPNAVIGSMPFFYHKSYDGKRKRFPSYGSVIIGDRVEIGASVCIDRGILENTLIGSDTKLDNLVQIGHGARVGTGVIIAAQTGIAGQAIIGDGVYIEGQVGVTPNVKIAAGAIIRGKSVVSRHIVRPGEYAGIRALPKAQESRRHAALSEIARLLPAIDSLQFSSIMETKEQVVDILQVISGRESEDISASSKLNEDLGLDSMDTLEVRMLVETRFNVQVGDDDVEGVRTVSDLIRVVMRLRQAALEK